MANEITKSLFGKDIRELTKEDLITFFQKEQHETDVLEFKTYIDEHTPGTDKATRDKKKIVELIVTICGFLNSDGGLLIWGAPKGKKSQGRKERSYQGEIRPVEYLLEQEQFINKIASEISPTPLRIKFHSIEFQPSSFCYVFEVARSEFGPHQYKGTYYMRMDGATHTAPHYFVEALMKKITYPRIEVFLNFGPVTEFISDFAAIPIQLSINNLSKYIPEKNIQCRIVCDKGDIFSVDAAITSSALAYGTDLLLKKIEILHYRVAHLEQFALVTNRHFSGTKSFKIVVFVNGELSPVITSTYDIQVFANYQNNYNVESLIVGKEENVYLSDIVENKELSEKEIIERSNQANLKIFEREIHRLPLYKSLWNKEG